MKCIQFDYEEKYIRDFLKLPKMLYTKENQTEVSNEVREILLDKHMLIKYIKELYKFVIYDDNNKIAARFAITTVKNDRVAYMGFFECVRNKRIARFLFKYATRFVKEKGYDAIVGPVDLNMWFKYRLKTDRFDIPPYTGEPYNREYYYKMFLDAGFEVKDVYHTHTYEKFGDDFNISKFEKRYNFFTKLGYEIRSIKEDEWDSAIVEVYELIMKLYSDFNTFIRLEREDFLAQFNSYKKILDMDFVTMAYYKGKIVGFSISIPNYGNAVYNPMNPINLLKIMKNKKGAKEYLITYMGVDPKHKGLARALTYVTIAELRKKDAECMGVLIKEGKVTNNFVDATLKFSYEYVLMEKALK